MDKFERYMRKKSATASEVIMTEVVCPNDANPMGFLQGGRLVQWMDIASAVAAQIHAGRICVTAGIDHVSFKAPVKVGDIVTIKAKITRVFNSSMEIYVQAYAQKVYAQKSQLINEAFFTFVTLDEKENQKTIPAIKPRSKEDKRLYQAALERRVRRIAGVRR